jgi:hypothetical protein
VNLAQIAKMDKGTWRVNDKYAVTVSGGSGMDGFFGTMVGGKAPAQAGAYALLSVGYTWGHAGFNWVCHKGRTLWSVMEFKHYHPIRGKFWTARPGKTTYFAVRLEDIEFVMPKEGDGWGSYPHVMIGGKEIELSVSGGGPGDDGCWTDWLSPVLGTMTNMPKSKLKAIVSKAVKIDGVKIPGELDCRDEDKLRTWQHLRRLMADRIGPASLKEGDRIVLGRGCHFYDGSLEAKAMEIEHRRHRCFTAREAWGTRVKFSQIDWVKTCALNGYAFPADFPVEPMPAPEKSAQTA